MPVTELFLPSTSRIKYQEILDRATTKRQLTKVILKKDFYYFWGM